MEKINEMGQGDTSFGQAHLRGGRPEAEQHKEGPVARIIESQTAKVPSDLFLWAAVGSIGVSAYLMYRRNLQIANFVGQWAPTLLLLGVYNKIVKVAGSDRLNQERPFISSKAKDSENVSGAFH